MDGKIDSNKLSNYLKIPIETVIFDEESRFEKTSIFQNLTKILIRHKNKGSDLTLFDMIRLISFTRSVPLTSIYEKTLSERSDNARINYVSSSLFTDTEISDEKKRVEIINASDQSGLGNRFADSLSNLGVNVVLVLTATKSQDKSVIYYYGDESYTVKKISSIFHYPTDKTKEKSLADVIIILGKDSNNSLSKF